MLGINAVWLGTNVVWLWPTVEGQTGYEGNNTPRQVCEGCITKLEKDPPTKIGKERKSKMNETTKKPTISVPGRPKNFLGKRTFPGVSQWFGRALRGILASSGRSKFVIGGRTFFDQKKVSGTSTDCRGKTVFVDDGQR